MTINGKEHKITLDWIAEEEKKSISEPNSDTRQLLKRRYLKQQGYEDVQDNCFCCEYACNKARDEGDMVLVTGSYCRFCPFNWSKDSDNIGKHNYMCETSNEKHFYCWDKSPAEEIANLSIHPIYLCCTLQGGNVNE